jgi:hypothetical protein
MTARSENSGNRKGGFPPAGALEEWVPLLLVVLGLLIMFQCLGRSIRMDKSDMVLGGT